MEGLDLQLPYWNGEGAGKSFSHPAPVDELLRRLGPGARVLDYGCGYGRVCARLAAAGFTNVVGADASSALVARGLRENPGLDLRVVGLPPLPFAEASFDACLLIALLTCIPSDAGADAVLAEAKRLLKPGGILFLSDYPLQGDARNRARYDAGEAEFGVRGVFRAGEAVFRHFPAQRIEALLSGFAPLWRREIVVTTLNGHSAQVLQILARRQGPA